MSLFDRFLKRKPSAPEAPDPNRELREQLYIDAFGPIESVFHETQDRGTHIDVYRFTPREGRTYHTYITGGMSNERQPGFPSDEPLARTELIFYSTAHDARYAELLRNFAHYPFETGAAINGWDTIPLGSHAENVIGSARFRNLLFCAATNKDDRNLAGKLKIDGEPVYPMMVVPLTDAEFDLLAASGVKALLDRISASSVSVYYDPSRESVV